MMYRGESIGVVVAVAKPIVIRSTVNVSILVFVVAINVSVSIARTAALKTIFHPDFFLPVCNRYILATSSHGTGS